MTLNSHSRRRIATGHAQAEKRAKSEALALFKPSKYRNVATVIDGIRFASKLEAKRYGELKLLQMAGEISSLDIHGRWGLCIGGMKICDYVDDFNYIDRKLGRIVVEDTKGVITADCRIKLKLMKAIHGIDVQLVRSNGK